MDENSLLLTHMEDLALRAQKTGMAHSKFLTAAQAGLVHAAYRNRKDVQLLLDGGFTEAERQIAIFLQPEWGSFAQEDILAGLLIHHRKQDTIRHKDVLGALLGLGLSRDVIGDIATQEDGAAAACLTSMAPFICQQLQLIGRVGVTITQVPPSGLPSLAVTLDEKEATVASLRLDAVLCAAFNLSRSEAGELIRAGLVQLAHQPCLDTTKTVQPEDILSLRGKGRVKLLAVKNLSRKGRQWITLGFYG